MLCQLKKWLKAEEGRGGKGSGTQGGAQMINKLVVEDGFRAKGDIKSPSAVKVRQQAANEALQLSARAFLRNKQKIAVFRGYY